MTLCNHILVDGFGAMGDALTCCNCGYSKYPEAIPFLVLSFAYLQGRIVREGDPRYDACVFMVQALQTEKR